MRRCRDRVLVLDKTVAGDHSVRRCRGGVLVLDKAVAGGDAVKRCRGGVLIVTWANKNAARRVGNKAFSQVGAAGRAVRQSGGGGLDKAGAEGKAVKRSGGGGQGNDGGHELPSNLGWIRGVHTVSVAAIVAEIVFGVWERGDGPGAAGGRWCDPTQANARGERLECSETAGLDEAGSGSVVMSCTVDVGVCMKGEEEVPRRSPGSSSVNPESGVVW